MKNLIAARFTGIVGTDLGTNEKRKAMRPNPVLVQTALHGPARNKSPNRNWLSTIHRRQLDRFTDLSLANISLETHPVGGEDFGGGGEPRILSPVQSAGTPGKKILHRANGCELSVAPGCFDQARTAADHFQSFAHLLH